MRNKGLRRVIKLRLVTNVKGIIHNYIFLRTYIQAFYMFTGCSAGDDKSATFRDFATTGILFYNN